MSTLVYTSSQLAAIRHISGPLLVNAGPGSGKTAVIIAHVRYLIHDLGADPEKILTVTFTNAAASEMQERFLKDESSGGASPVFSTIHSMFYHILRHSSSARPLRMISNQDQDAFWKECLPDTGPVSFSLRKELTARISRAVNTGGSVEDIRLPGISSDQLILILRRYQDYKAQQGLLDYDDILTNTVDLLRNDPSIRAYWQQQYPFLLVDEFQDINPLQYQGLILLTPPSGHLFTVGDEDQSIYGFRGSSPDILKQFRLDFPDAKEIRLDVSHRSPDVLLEPARNLIHHNKNRTEKRMTGLSASAANAGWTVKSFPDQLKQYQWIAQKAHAYDRGGIPLSRQAVLLRSFRDLSILRSVMMKSGIPVHVPGYRESIFTHFITEDIRAILKLAQKIPERKDVLCVLSVFCPHVSRYRIPKHCPPAILSILMRSIQHSPGGRLCDQAAVSDNRKELQELIQLNRHMHFLGSLPPGAALEYIYSGMGYRLHLRDLAHAHHQDITAYQTPWEQLRQFARKFSTQKRFLSCLNDPSEQDFRFDPDPADGQLALQILTMHGSKGLEFDVVYIPDLNKGIMPASQNKDLHRGGTDEERRLLYVAITRAKRLLHISYVERIHGKKVFPSEFLQQLYSDNE